MIGASDHRQDEHDNDQPEVSDPVIDFASVLGQEVADDVAAVQRRQRDQIEYAENNVDQDGQLRTSWPAGWRRRRRERRVETAPLSEPCKINARQMTARNAVRKLLTGPATAVRMSSRTGFLKIAVVDRRGFRPSEGRKADQDQHRRHKDGAEQVDVNQRIEGNASQHFGGRVTQAIGHPGVRRFVDADGEQQNHDLEEYG